jgi:hypothetical protein
MLRGREVSGCRRPGNGNPSAGALNEFYTLSRKAPPPKSRSRHHWHVGARNQKAACSWCGLSICQENRNIIFSALNLNLFPKFVLFRFPGSSGSAHQGGGGGDADESCAWAAFSNRVDAREQQGVQTRVLECVFAGQNRRSFGNRDFDKLPGPQPASLSRSQLETLRTRPYAVLEKSDGERCTPFIFELDNKQTCV